MKKLITILSLGLLLNSTSLLALEKAHTGTILETLNVGEFTYIKFQENKAVYWMALPKCDLKKGEQISMKEALEIKNFRNEGMNKNFERISLADTQK